MDSIHFTIFLLTTKDAIETKYKGKEVLFVYDNAKLHVGKICSRVFDSLPFVRRSPYSHRMNLIEYGLGFFKKDYARRIYRQNDNYNQEETVNNLLGSVSLKQFRRCCYEMNHYLLKNLNKYFNS